MEELLDREPEALAAALASRGRRRAAFVGRADGTPAATEDWLAGVARALAARGSWRRHEALLVEVGRESGALFAAAIHSTVRGQALGGVRRAPYARLGDLLDDVLGLALAMTRKAALAGLWWGGGKAGIAAPEAAARDPVLRRAVYRDFGRFVSGLRGVYVTAEDAGTTPGDMAAVFEATRFATCVPPEVGGSGNPAPWTAAGVLCAMEAAVEAIGAGGLAGKSVAVQGGGQVGLALVERLLERGVAHIRVDELAPERVELLRRRFRSAPVEVERADPARPGVLAAPCDILAPCALGGVLGPKTLLDVRARVVCGAANNPLEDEARDGAVLHERGIVYVPDYVANRMGLVHCANEQYGTPDRDPAVERHLDPEWEEGIASAVRRILARSGREDVPPAVAAAALADEAAARPHPLWPGRGRALLEALEAERWWEGPGEGRELGASAGPGGGGGVPPAARRLSAGPRSG